jgi:conjugative transfer pilus assembly protein TraH
MMSVGTSIPGSGMAETMIANYKEIVAADYASTFLRQFAEVGTAALTKQHRLRPEQQLAANRQREDAQRFMTQLQQEQQILYGKVNSVSTVVDDLERLERTMRASLSNHVMDMLGYSARALK